MKWVLQRRTLRKQHIDQKYGAKIIKNVRHLAALVSEHALVVMMDDKASVPIGPPGVPVGATRRQRHVLAPIDNLPDSADHDIVVQHLTPSVSVLMKPPTDPMSKHWYAGSPMVTLKCAIFEHSNPFRHMTELSDRLDAEGHQESIIIGLTDGGGDRNTSHISVQLGYICFFLRHDLDFLCFARTPPYYSTLNPCERVMSTLNGALYGLALERDKLDLDENIVKNLVSKAAWREAAVRHPNKDIPVLAKRSAQKVKDELNQRFSRLTYKGEKVLIGEAATNDEVEKYKQELKIFFPNADVDIKNISKQEAMKNQLLKEFYDKHIRVTQYMIQIKKCEDLDCKYHGWIRVGKEVFDKILWCPTPHPLNDINYKTFQDTHGTEPSDDFRPGKKETKNDEDKKPEFKLQPHRARKIVVCNECSFPRILYTKLQLKKNEMNILNDHLEDVGFMCGSAPDIKDENFPKIYTTSKDYCRAKVSLQYYQLYYLPNFQMCCANCLETNLTNEQRKEKIPICTGCKFSMPARKSLPEKGKKKAKTAKKN